MSLDISLVFEPETGGKPVSLEVYTANITHNLTPMWRQAGCYWALYASDGSLAVEIVAALKSAYAMMYEQLDCFKALEPSNKWGSYEGALKFLDDLIQACEDYPKAIVRVSR